MPAAPTTDRARAVGLATFGEPDVLGVVERAVPDLGADDVRIRVRAAAVNPTDLLFRAGARAQMLAAFEAPYVLGVDAAGTVEATRDG
jgi:NADPH2:quinone reductase